MGGVYGRVLSDNGRGLNDSEKGFFSDSVF